MSKIDEIKAGGVKGCLGIDQIDWGGQAGKCYECWKCEPCCGSPCNPKDAIVCMATWYCCSLCAATRLYSSSLGHNECAIIPDCLFLYCCTLCAGVATRYNLRKKHGVHGNICGDLVCTWFCGCCSYLQLLRASAIHDWAIIPCKITVKAPDMRVIL